MQTALHKAALNGHMSIIQYLLANKADVHARDADGWTALHNACSKVSYLSKHFRGAPHPFSRGILTLYDGSVKAVALRMKWVGYAVLTFAIKEAGLLSVGRLPFSSPSFSTTLFTVNAASKGHLPVVMYLLSKQAADPLVRNNWGETAYDVAASVFEVWICEV